MKLPASWVDRIFEKLTLVYGRSFIGQWDGVPITDVKADWAHELGGFHDKPDAIAHALKNLPADRPPNVLQFRAMCQKSPGPVFKALPAPPQDEARVEAAIAQAWEILRKPKPPKGAPA